MEEDRVSQEDVVAAGSGEGENVSLDVIDEELLDIEIMESMALEDVATAAAGVGLLRTDQDPGSGIDTQKFVELYLSEEEIVGAQNAWQTFINQAPSREAAGEAVYAALFDSSPALQALFVTPRAVQALRFMNGLNTFISSLGDPAALKSHVETLGFGHLNMDVTVPRVLIFRDALVDLFAVELGSKLDTNAANGLIMLLNYVGGALIFTRLNYALRLRILAESWAVANDKGANSEKFATLEVQHKDGKNRSGLSAAPSGAQDSADGDAKDGKGGKGDANMMMQNVPTTYKEMFQFNAAVMGFGTSVWMNEVLAVFDNIVKNVANSGRLQEECCILVLRIARITGSKISLNEYKSCMLASLRSLLPKDWTTEHEVAWSWMWENVEKLLLMNMGKTQAWEKAVGALIDSIDEATGYQIRSDIYAKFFVASPVGEGYFKQSNTYLHIIATKVIQMCVDIYREPVRMVDFVSGLGLRHVGYAIPTDLFGPFVSTCVEVVQCVGAADAAVEGFRWALALVAKMLVRTILEGSTIVMKAINNNSVKTLQKAIGCAPRGNRADWMLIIKVGTQDISPLHWSIQSGALESSSAMIKDLLTFRADRAKYYYAAEELFKRHHDIVKVLSDDAPQLLPELLNGLIWRSRVTVGGLRRVNYFIKYLLMDPERKFAKTIEWVVQSKDPRIVCHPVLILLGDLVWSRVASRSFILRKSWFLITLAVFIASQSIIKSVRTGEETQVERNLTFVMRIFIYGFSMGHMLFSHLSRIFKACHTKSFIKVFGYIPVPAYLENWQEVGNLVLMFCLIIMMVFEPIFRCVGEDGDKLFTVECDAAENVKFFPYSVFTMFAMVLYFVLLIDMAVFNNRVSAYVLVCGRMLSELILFLIATVCVLLMLSCAFSCLHVEIEQFKDIPSGIMSLWEMMIGIYATSDYEVLHDEPVILAGCFLFLVLSVVFLLNLLVAQLSCAYDAIYADMVGFARLKRLRIITESMPQVKPSRWLTFLNSLNLEERIEFNEGDVGLAGGIQVQEAASAHPTTTDQIRRYGGSTSPTIEWPEDGNMDDDSDRFERIEALIKKVMDQLAKNRGTRHKGRSSSSSGGIGQSGSGSGSQIASGGGHAGRSGGSVSNHGEEEEQV